MTSACSLVTAFVLSSRVFSSCGTSVDRSCDSYNKEREGSPTLLLNQEMPSHLLNLWFEFLQLFLPLLLVLKLCVQLWEKLRDTLIQTVRYLLGGGRNWETTTSWDYTPRGWNYFIPCLIPKFTCTRAWEQAYTIMCFILKFTCTRAWEQAYTIMCLIPKFT